MALSQQDWSSWRSVWRRSLRAYWGTDGGIDVDMLQGGHPPHVQSYWGAVAPGCMTAVMSMHLLRPRWRNLHRHLLLQGLLRAVACVQWTP